VGPRNPLQKALAASQGRGRRLSKATANTGPQEI
jgi:hypothetical protein